MPVAGTLRARLGREQGRSKVHGREEVGSVRCKFTGYGCFMLPDYSAHVSPPSPRVIARIDALVTGMCEDDRAWLEEEVIPDLMMNDCFGACTELPSGALLRLVPVGPSLPKLGREAEAMSYAVERGFRPPRQQKRGESPWPAVSAFLRKRWMRTAEVPPEELFQTPWRIFARIEKSRPIP